jgi:hypothetical protein
MSEPKPGMPPDGGPPPPLRPAYEPGPAVLREGLIGGGGGGGGELKYPCIGGPCAIDGDNLCCCCCCWPLPKGKKGTGPWGCIMPGCGGRPCEPPTPPLLPAAAAAAEAKDGGKGWTRGPPAPPPGVATGVG